MEIGNAMPPAILATAAGLCFFAAACSAEHITSAPLNVPEEEGYAFLSVTDGPCVPKMGVDIDKKYRSQCQQKTAARRYRGTWLVDAETSLFTPGGPGSCERPGALTRCAQLEGKSLPWPSRWACPRVFEIDIIGRRNVFPQLYGGLAYKISVEKVLSARRVLPDPPHEAGECEPSAP